MSLYSPYPIPVAGLHNLLLIKTVGYLEILFRFPLYFTAADPLHVYEPTSFMICQTVFKSNNNC